MGWIIFGCILAVLIGILCLDLTFTVHYSEAFLISVGVGPFKYGLLVTEEERQNGKQKRSKRKPKRKSRLRKKRNPERKRRSNSRKRNRKREI